MVQESEELVAGQEETQGHVQEHLREEKHLQSPLQNNLQEEKQDHVKDHVQERRKDGLQELLMERGQKIKLGPILGLQERKKEELSDIAQAREGKEQGFVKEEERCVKEMVIKGIDNGVDVSNLLDEQKRAKYSTEGEARLPTEFTTSDETSFSGKEKQNTWKADPPSRKESIREEERIEEDRTKEEVVVVDSSRPCHMEPSAKSLQINEDDEDIMREIEEQLKDI